MKLYLVLMLLVIVELTASTSDSELIAVLTETTIYRWYDLYAFAIKHICEEPELSAYDLHIFKWDSMTYDVEWLKETIKYRCSIKAPRSSAFDINDEHLQKIEDLYMIANHVDQDKRYKEYYGFYLNEYCLPFINARNVKFNYHAINDIVVNIHFLSPEYDAGVLDEIVENNAKLIADILKKNKAIAHFKFDPTNKHLVALFKLCLYPNMEMRAIRLYENPPFPFSCHRSENHVPPFAALTQSNDITNETPSIEDMVKFFTSTCTLINRTQLSKLLTILEVAYPIERLQSIYGFFMKYVYYLTDEGRIPSPVSEETLNQKINNHCSASLSENMPADDVWMEEDITVSPTPSQ